MKKKITTFGQIRAALEQVGALVAQVVQAAAQDISALDRKKQDKITGTAGQVVGFNAEGQPAAQGTESLRGPVGPAGKDGGKGEKGDSGTRGSLFYWGDKITGTSTTASVFSGSGISSALVNDLYLNTSNWNVYQCTTAGAASAAKWAYKGNIRGATGATGQTGAPGPKGDKGDKGDTGATGAAGAKGATGTRGSLLYWGTAISGTNATATVFSGSGIASALVNDLYLNTTNWNVYQCTTAGAATVAKWAYKGNIKGSKGDKGDKGDTGATGPRGPAGSNATVTVDTALSASSTNPVQNKVVKAALDGKVNGSGLTFSVVNGILTINY